MPGQRASTLARNLQAVGQKNILLDAKDDAAFVQAHLKNNPKDCLEIKRLIKNNQLAAMRGEAPLDEDKVVNNNLNKIQNMSVTLMKRALLEGTEGVVTPQMLHKMMKKKKENLWRMYQYMVAEDKKTPVAPGSTIRSLHKYNVARIEAVGKRFKFLALKDDEPDWQQCGPYVISRDANDAIVIVYRWIPALQVSSLPKTV